MQEKPAEYQQSFEGTSLWSIRSAEPLGVSSGRSMDCCVSCLVVGDRRKRGCTDRSVSIHIGGHLDFAGFVADAVFLLPPTTCSFTIFLVKHTPPLYNGRRVVHGSAFAFARPLWCMSHVSLGSWTLRSAGDSAQKHYLVCDLACTAKGDDEVLIGRTVHFRRCILLSSSPCCPSLSFV